MEINDFTAGYLDCLLWTGVYVDNPDTGEIKASDDEHNIDEIHPAALREIITDCLDFQAGAGDLITENLNQAGHDFYLSRNGHGAGFWDSSCWGDNGDKLHEMAKPYGTFALLLYNDKLHASH